MPGSVRGSAAQAASGLIEAELQRAWHPSVSAAGPFSLQGPEVLSVGWRPGRTRLALPLHHRRDDVAERLRSRDVRLR